MAKDPFAQLANAKRRITPRTLRGRKKELWKQFVERYRAGEYAGISVADLHEWAKQNFGLNCSVGCLYQALRAPAAAKAARAT
jgi:hypothetical protein